MSEHRGRPRTVGIRNEVIVICKRDRKVSILRLRSLLPYSQSVIDRAVQKMSKDGQIKVSRGVCVWIPEAGLDRLLHYWPHLTAKIGT